MSVPIGLKPPASLAFVVRAGLSVPDLTTVLSVSLAVLFPDGTTQATWSALVPPTVPANVRGFEALAGTPNPAPNYLVGVHVFSAADGATQVGVYRLRALLSVSGYSDPVPAKVRTLEFVSPFADQ